ncbi:unnamed protein product [Urochloa humidicola]
MIKNIIDTPKVFSSDPDKLCWMPSLQGECTTKQAYKYISNTNPHALPSQGLRHISPQALAILKTIWKHKTIPPRIKTFAWRLIRHALATGQRAGNLSDKIDKNCRVCGKLESDFHIFFDCCFARMVWFSAHPVLRTECLTPQLEGVQDTLCTILAGHFSELLQQVLTRLWFLWKARNDLRFNNIRWSAFRVCNETAADILASWHLLSSQNTLNHSTHITSPPNNTAHNAHQVAMLLPTHGRSSSSPLQGQEHSTEPPSVVGFTDAALSPDGHQQAHRAAGLGVCMDLRSTEWGSFLHIQASMQAPSVLMAELLALLLGAQVAARLHVSHLRMGSDSLLAVHHLHNNLSLVPWPLAATATNFTT